MRSALACVHGSDFGPKIFISSLFNGSNYYLLIKNLFYYLLFDSMSVFFV